MRKLVLFFVVIQAASSFAAPLESFTEVTKGIATYLPFVKMLVYILAALVGIAGGVFAAFIKMQDENANVKPYIVGTAASCFVLIASAVALPQFFGYDADGGGGQLIASLPQTGSGGSGNTSDYNGINGDYIKTEIPDLSDPRWQNDPRYQTITVNGISTTVASFLNDLYDFVGGGSIGKMVDAINEMFKNGMFDRNTYNALMNNVGNLTNRK